MKTALGIFRILRILLSPTRLLLITAFGLLSGSIVVFAFRGSPDHPIKSVIGALLPFLWMRFVWKLAPLSKAEIAEVNSLISLGEA